MPEGGPNSFKEARFHRISLQISRLLPTCVKADRRYVLRYEQAKLQKQRWQNECNCWVYVGQRESFLHHASLPLEIMRQGRDSASTPNRNMICTANAIIGSGSIYVQVEKQAPAPLPARVLGSGHVASAFARSRRKYTPPGFAWRRCQHNWYAATSNMTR